MSDEIGQVRWRLRVPHLELADYRLLQRLVVRQYAQSRRWTNVLGFLIGGAIGLSMVLAAYALNFWMDGSMALGFGRRTILLVEDESFWLAALGMVIAGAAAMQICIIVNYRRIVRRIHEASVRTTPNWSLEIGEGGLQMMLNEVSATIPWSGVRSLQSGHTASFLALSGYFKVLGISYAGFTTDAEREACLAFMTAKIAATKS